MRKTVHRILSAAPMFALALLALLATANQDEAKNAWRWWSEALSDQRFFWFCVAFVVAYAALWWATAGESRSRHQRLIERGLRPIHQELLGFRSAFAGASTDEQFKQSDLALTGRYREAIEWINFNMGAAAVAKFTSDAGSLNFHYNWEGEHEPEVAVRRTNLLNWIDGRIKAVEGLMASDAWDGPGPSRWMRFQQWRKERAERSKPAI